MIQGRQAPILASILLIVAACRPQLGPTPTPTPSSIAGDLAPQTEMTVGLHLPGALGILAGPAQLVGIDGTTAAAKVSLSVQPFSAGADAFIGAGRTDAVDLFVADTATAMKANALGNDLVMVASLQARSSWTLLTLDSSPLQDLGGLDGSTIYVDGLVGDEVPLLAALANAGISAEQVTLQYPEDPSFAIDPAILASGTVAAAFVRTFDGYLRLGQYPNPDTGASVGEEFYRVLPIGESGATLGFWASAASLESDDAKKATAVALIALSDASAKCRDDEATCASTVYDSSISDLSLEALSWALEKYNESLWPNALGLFAIDLESVQSEIDVAAKLGIIGATPASSVIDQTILDLAQSYWPADVDRNGASFTPKGLAIP